MTLAIILYILYRLIKATYNFVFLTFVAYTKKFFPALWHSTCYSVQLVQAGIDRP